MRRLSRILVTGGAGFIGSNFIRYLFKDTDFDGLVINVDKLTYAGSLENLRDIEQRWGGERYFFERKDICDYDGIEMTMKEYSVDTIVHFAAESHVDRSIFGPKDFVRTNILGTFNLLEAARERWKDRDDVLLHHISTDEVFGSLGETGRFTEGYPYDPRSPYSASKAAADHLVRAMNHTYGIPTIISNCSNNYGPYQFPEKLIPFMILSAINENPLPVYGDGRNIRDWIYVDEHVSAIWLIINKGRAGETYNIGGQNEWKNIDLVNLLCERIAAKKGKERDHYKRLIRFVKDRPGHDRRYAIDCEKIKRELGWKPRFKFEQGIDLTIDWYLGNADWVRKVTGGRLRMFLCSRT
jgi:dTDP-glucose 4,6-dehydratase